MANPYASLIEALEKVYGPASEAGFGSAVFHGSAAAADTCETVSFNWFKTFLGSGWRPDREAAWLSGWKQVYLRPAGTKGDILLELNAVTDAEGKRSIPLLTELIEQADAGRAALTGAFNHPDVQNLCVHRLGDGEAMSGIMINAVYKGGIACSVIALMD